MKEEQYFRNNADQNEADGYRWHWKSCKHHRNVRDHSFFANNGLPWKQPISNVYCCSCNIAQNDININFTSFMEYQFIWKWKITINIIYEDSIFNNRLSFAYTLDINLPSSSFCQFPCVVNIRKGMKCFVKILIKLFITAKLFSGMIFKNYFQEHFERITQSSKLYKKHSNIFMLS